MTLRTLKQLLTVWLILFSTEVAVAQDRPRVVAVNHSLQYFAERLLGETADVVFPVPPGVDPSFWRPSIADISMIQSADLILLNGAGFATWVDRVSLPRSKLVNTSAAIEDQFIVTESITHSHGDGGEHSHEGVASYLWLNPSLATLQAEAIAAAITARKLAPADDVAARLDALRADLDALDTMARAALQDMQSIAFIATHPRYEYFERRYGLSIASLEWEAGSIPSNDQIENLRSLVAQTGAQILIWEASPPTGAFDLTADLGLQNIVFPPLARAVEGQSYIDSLKETISSISNLDVQ
ncbi:MAG: metal ABC transporter substrate-binding protein [Pseudomonadota bacterium]